jgi:hypothetical protein
MIKAMDQWNKDVEKIIGRIPKSGFEEAGNLRAEIDRVLKGVKESARNAGEAESDDP